MQIGLSTFFVMAASILCSFEILKPVNVKGEEVDPVVHYSGKTMVEYVIFTHPFLLVGARSYFNAVVSATRHRLNVVSYRGRRMLRLWYMRRLWTLMRSCKMVEWIWGGGGREQNVTMSHSLTVSRKVNHSALRLILFSASCLYIPRTTFVHCFPLVFPCVE